MRPSYGVSNTKISNGQKKMIYTLAQSLGLVDKMATVDGLHEMIYSITGKEHTSDLTSLEADQVINRLKGNMKGFSRFEPAPRAANMATEGEKKKIWALMYELRKYDTTIQSNTLAKRLIGFLKKYGGIDAHPKDPFKFLTHEKANSVIEGLKGLIQTERRKASN